MPKIISANQEWIEWLSQTYDMSEFFMAGRRRNRSVIMEKWFTGLENIVGVACTHPPPTWNSSNPPPSTQLSNLGSLKNPYVPEPFPGSFEDYEKDAHLAELIEGKTVALWDHRLTLLGNAWEIS